MLAEGVGTKLRPDATRHWLVRRGDRPGLNRLHRLVAADGRAVPGFSAQDLGAAALTAISLSQLIGHGYHPLLPGDSARLLLKRHRLTAATQRSLPTPGDDKLRLTFGTAIPFAYLICHLASPSYTAANPRTWPGLWPTNRLATIL